jgi:hypothetical protein
MPSAGIETVIPTHEQPNIYAFDRKTAGIGIMLISADVMRLIFLYNKLYEHYLSTVRDFRLRHGDENWTLQGYYPANYGNFLQTFRDNLSVQSSGILDP